MNKDIKKDRTCWTCNFQLYTAQDTFLGNCSCPAPNNPDRNKPIPPEIVDRSCNKWIQRSTKTKENKFKDDMETVYTVLGQDVSWTSTTTTVSGGITFTKL